MALSSLVSYVSILNFHHPVRLIVSGHSSTLFCSTLYMHVCVCVYVNIYIVVCAYFYTCITFIAVVGIIV